MNDYWISLGQVSTLNEAKERLARVKENIKYKIQFNKYKIKVSDFKLKIEKEDKDLFGNKNAYAYYLYVKTPDNKYNWMFLA